MIISLGSKSGHDAAITPNGYSLGLTGLLSTKFEPGSEGVPVEPVIKGFIKLLVGLMWSSLPTAWHIFL